MIDWITAVVPCTHIEPIRDGCFQKVAGTGEVEWSSDRRMTVKGSHDSGVSIRTASWEGDCTHIEISGNLAKFFQGHNLWGTDDLPGLLFEFLRWLALEHGGSLVYPNADDIHAWRSGDIALHRVDVTQSFHLASLGEVLSWLRIAEQTAHLAHRGRGQLTKGSTLYFGKNSRRWSLKLYAKGQEIRAPGHGQDAVLNLPSAVAWADRTLRAEMTIRSMELKRVGLSQVSQWMPNDGVPFDPAELLREKLGDMTMTTTRTLPDDVLAQLSAAQRTAYLAWLSGADLRDVMPHRSFYRLRSKLLPHGIDLATVMPKEGPCNVVPLHRVLEAVPATVPDWAIGTPLFFEPRRVA